MTFSGVLVFMICLRNLKDILNSCQNRSKNKLVSENAATRATWKLLAPVHGLLTLRYETKRQVVIKCTAVVFVLYLSRLQ